MSIESLKEKLPPYVKDVRLNLSSLAANDSLSSQRKYGLMVACGIATRNPVVASAMEAEAKQHLSAEALDAARAAASIMAMNNIYYRFVHLASNKEYGSMPAQLRMSVVGNPGIDKVDFELWSLAVSAINGCGLCIDSHEKVLRDAGVSAAEIQTAVRFAAIIQSAAVAVEAAAAPLAAAG